MEAYIMTNEQIQAYAESLRMEEHSESTVQKYANALTAFYDWLAEDKSVTKERLLLWKAKISFILAVRSHAVNRKASNAPEKSIKRHENQAGSLNFFAPSRIFAP